MTVVNRAAANAREELEALQIGLSPGLVRAGGGFAEADVIGRTADYG